MRRYPGFAWLGCPVSIGMHMEHPNGTTATQPRCPSVAAAVEAGVSNSAKKERAALGMGWL